MTKREFKVGDRVAFDIQVYNTSTDVYETKTDSLGVHTVRKRGTITSVEDGQLWIETDTSRILFKRDARDVKRLVKKPKEKSVGVTRKTLKETLWANSYIRSMNLEKFHDFYTEFCRQLGLG